MTAANAPRLPEAEAFREECDALHALLAGIDAKAWAWPSTFKGWSAIDVVGHLHLADRAALVALDGADAFYGFMAGFRAAIEAGGDAAAYTRGWHGLDDGPTLLARWRAFADTLADRYREIDPRARIPWGRGPDMSARSCMGARQMETWAHGQALFDLFDAPRAETDRIRNIAALGVNTYRWTFRVRGLDAPEPPPFVRLTAPSGAIWAWNDADAADRVVGSAVEFCQVVTQTRNVADTGLVATGQAARAWMGMAQCFAGAPHDPPAAGLRTRRGRPPT